jgi:hypothetical protein
MSGALQVVYQNIRSFTTVPGAPTIGTATATGSTTATVSFTAPASDGGATITLYTATSSPGGITGTLAQSGSGTISITGLSGNTSYTFTVKATNSVGESLASSASNSITTQPIIGQAYGGGFYAGQISTAGNGVADYNLVISPKASGDTIKEWKSSSSSTPGADSLVDGAQNTADMVAAGGSTVYPAAHFCNDLVVGGFSDWYMPAKNELEICYYNLKPDTTSNNTSSGINANAVPSRSSNYTTGTPTQTLESAFQAGGAEAFNLTTYWSSSEFSDTRAWSQVLYDGQQDDAGKIIALRVRAIRRVAI